MKEQTVRVYAADAERLADASLYEASYRAATDVRREKAERLRFPKDKRLSLAAELLLRYALLEEGTDPLSLQYEYAPGGKPILRQPEGFCFSLSHSGSLALCALAPWDVGCDVERIGSVDLTLAERFFATQESSLIAEQNSEAAQQTMFYRFWTLKESFLKITGLGMRLPLANFCFDLTEDGIIVRQSVDERTYFFREYALQDGYCCAVSSIHDAFAEQAVSVDPAAIIESVYICR